MSAKKPTKSKKKAPLSGFTVLMTVNKEQYTSTADTLEDALLNLPHVDPHTRAVLIVVEGDKHSRPVALSIPMYRRLFYPGLTGQVQRAQFIKRYQTLV